MKGNALAVVVDGQDLSDQQMQDFAAWTNLAETTFLSSPTVQGADYKVRIFTPAREMPFAGHPTLGSCAAWLHSGGIPTTLGVVRQECGVGLVDIDVSGSKLAFAAPPTTQEPLEAGLELVIRQTFKINAACIVRSVALSNGPHWKVLELDSAAAVLEVDSRLGRYPAFVGIGLIGPHPTGSECDFEVRMLCPSSGMSEDPVTGSLCAAIARWKYGSGEWTGDKLIAQGTRLGRRGRVYLRRDKVADQVWVGGHVCPVISGTVEL